MGSWSLVMEKEIGSYEAKTHLPEILRRVKAGEHFTITIHGHAVADLIPSRMRNRVKAQSAVSNLLKMAEGRTTVADDDLADMRNQGRK